MSKPVAKHICIHEAAHAVHAAFMTRALGADAWTFHRVTVIPTDTHLGQSVVSTSKSWGVKRHHIVNLLVGLEAELHITRRHHGLGFWNDHLQAWHLINTIYPGADPDEEFEYFRKEARRFAREHRGHIERVADALRTAGRLTGDEVGNLIMAHEDAA